MRKSIILRNDPIQGQHNPHLCGCAAKKQIPINDLCIPNDSFSVLFAGDSKHPEKSVFQDIRDQSNLYCLTNGLKDSSGKKFNPLGIDLEGAKAFGKVSVCNPKISYEMHLDGRVVLKEGRQCEFCMR